MTRQAKRPDLRLCALVCLVLAGCGSSSQPALGGDPENGQRLLRQFGCGSCHRIPGVATATGNVGPPLEGVGRRVYLAGVLPNTPENMAKWIRNPLEFEPETAMPNLGVTARQARDMTAYLQTLK